MLKNKNRIDKKEMTSYCYITTDNIQQTSSNFYGFLTYMGRGESNEEEQ